MENASRRGGLIRGFTGVAALLLAVTVGRTAVAGVVFSEIMYHPVDGVTNIIDGDEYEFIELGNAGTVPVSLQNASFTKGITYTFTNAASLAVGQYLVVVKNRTAFTNRYPAVTNLAPGVYTGSLANNGEKVTLKDSLGNTLYSTTYGTSGAWTTWPDGEGCSLVLKDPGGNPDDPANWGPSSQYNGTPGTTGGCATVDIVINEVLSHTDPPLEDAIEVHNLTTNTIDVSGWYLSDEAAVRRKYRITNAVVAARGFKVFYEYQFNTNALFDTNNIAFEFSSSRGDQAYLTATNGPNTLRVVDLVRFEAAENGVSFGRYPNGTGDWVTLNRVTMGTSVAATNPASDLGTFRSGQGASNSLPKVGPVVIGEIMYHPANGSTADEYLELVNVTTNAVKLYDPIWPSNTWKLTTAVEFTFPTNVVIPAAGRLLVVGTTNVPAFRTAYGLSTNIPIVGAWTGQLSNAGDSVRLYKPDPPDPGTNFVPYILVDRVDFADAAPWPTAPDGDGPSLERVVATNYGNTAVNWFTGAVGGSPGAAPAGGFINAQVTPAWPQPGQSMTVSVFVVSQATPTQIVCRAVVNGATNLYVMSDGGTNGDGVAGDRVYTTVFAPPPVGAWLYYTFQGASATGIPFVFPAPELRPLRAPLVALDMRGGTPQSIISAGDDWATYEVFDTVSASDFSIRLLSEGEVLIDDVSVTDENGIERVANGNFSGALSGPWALNGNHVGSIIETLSNEGSNRVLHVVASGAPLGSDGVSQGLSLTPGTVATLRFRTRRVRAYAERWLWVKIGTPPPDVVVNEIMYHSDREDDLTGIDPYEYVELYNPGTSSVSLTGWYLDGVGFDIPTGTTVGAGQYLVCCASQQAVRVAYGIANTVGDWAETRAQLKNGGEAVTLFNPYWRAVDLVDYDDKEPWSVAADGYGPSLERLVTAAAGNTSVNWAASATGTNWVQVSWTGQVGAAAVFHCYFTNAAARCWLDEVSVKRVGGGAELITNGGFEQGTNGWSFSGNHARSRVEAGMGVDGSNALAVAGTYSRWQMTVAGSLAIVVAYGDAASNCVSSSTLGTQEGSNYIVSCRLKREGLSGDVRIECGTFGVSIGLGSHGTPGRSNMMATATLPVGLMDVRTDYATCPVGTSNVVRATVDTRVAVSNMTVRYRVVTSNGYEYTDAAYGSVAMRDDGVAPDLVATDGVFAAYLPAQATNRVMVRYHVTVTATNRLVSRRPHTDDPSTDYGYWVETGSLQTNLPNWTMFIDGNPVVYPIGARACAVAPNGQVFIDAMVRHRGNPSSGYETRTGVALRVNRGNLLDTWFADNQGGINFRHRGNDHSHTLYRRVINEYLGYELQRTMGLATPRYRHCCLWINGAPTITTELEDPEEAFLSGNNIPNSDFLTQVGYGGRQWIGGDPALDNFWTAFGALLDATGPQKEARVRFYLAYESIQQSMALLALTANADQHFEWNMFQHRDARDRRWRQYPWDVDMSFDVYTNVAVTNLHPYYSTPDHASIWDTNMPPRVSSPLGNVLFYPESGADSQYTLPFRFRQQRSVWRQCYTLFTTNYLYPVLDNLQNRLKPAYQQVDPSQFYNVTQEVQNVKAFIAIRRNFLLNGSWSDKDPGLWASTNVYTTTNVVINEIMYNPPLGGEYVELYNAGRQAVDLSWWMLTTSNEAYRIPLGTMLGPTSYLVIADAEWALTNAYSELADAATMVPRYRETLLWDWPTVWESATEYATRVAEIPSITLPASNTTLRLYDQASNIVDAVSYGVGGAWPSNTGASLELIDPHLDNGLPASWRACRIVGTPGMPNSAAADADSDGMPDAWEQRIVNASSGSFTSVLQVLPGADFDNDGIANFHEYVAGTDPTTNDVAALQIWIERQAPGVRVDFDTVAATGAYYDLYSARLYDLECVTNRLVTPVWAGVSGYTSLVGVGQAVVFTNAQPGSNGFYRYGIRLQPRR